MQKIFSFVIRTAPLTKYHIQPTHDRKIKTFCECLHTNVFLHLLGLTVSVKAVQGL